MYRNEYLKYKFRYLNLKDMMVGGGNWKDGLSPQSRKLVEELEVLTKDLRIDFSDDWNKNNGTLWYFVDTIQESITKVNNVTIKQNLKLLISDDADKKIISDETVKECFKGTIDSVLKQIESEPKDVADALIKRMNQFPIPLLIKDQDRLNVMPLRGSLSILLRYYEKDNLINDDQKRCAKDMIGRVSAFYKYIYDNDILSSPDPRLIALLNLIGPSRIYIGSAATSVKDYIVEHYGKEGESKMTDAYQITKPDSFDIDLLMASTSNENQRIVNEITRRLSIIHDSISSVWKRKNNNLTLFLQYYDVPLLRQFTFTTDQNSITLSSNTAGATNINPDARINDMRLWRGGEEVIKLLTHEGIHLFDDTLDGIKDAASADKVHNDFAVGKKKYLIYECRTEGLARIMNSIILAFELSDNFEQTIKEIWTIEKLFGLYQVAKLLYLAGFNSFREFCSPQTEGMRLKDNGASIEYFILKSFAIYQLEEFMINLKMNDGNVYNLIISAKDSQAIERIINSLIDKIRGQDKSSILFKTGRQTVIEKEIGIAVD